VPTEAAFETNPANIEDDLNNVRSQLHNLMKNHAGNWWDDLNTPSTLDTGSQRGVNDLNTDLHAVEKKRVLSCIWNLHSVTGGALQGVVLGASDLPANLIAAVGAVTTIGTVVATATTFTTFSAADVVAGASSISPKNMVELVDSATRDPILDTSGRRIYGLLQGESGLTDGDTITSTTTNRVQISYVVIVAGVLTLAAATEMSGVTFDYCSVERKRLEDLTEEEFLRGANVDVPGGTSVTRQVAYDNQGTTPVDLTTNATLDLEGAGLEWKIRDDLEADLFGIVEGSAGGTSQVNIYAGVDEFDVDAAVNNFLQGITADSGGTRPITVGVTDGEVTTTAGDLMVRAAGELLFDDVNQGGSTWAQDGIKLSETTAEWDAYEVAFGGEVSLLNAIVQAAAASTTRQVARAKVQNGNHVAGTNITGAGGTPELDAQLIDHSAMTFVTDVDTYLNGVLMWPAAGATEDVYPGDTPADGDIKFTFTVKGSGANPDVITMITWA